MPAIVPIGTRRKIRNPMPQKYVNAITKKCVYLINIWEITFPGLQRTYGSYSVFGRKPNEPYSVTQVHGRIELMDEGDEKYGMQATECEEIAADLCAQCNDAILTGEGQPASFMGVFVSPTIPPPPALLREMQQKLAEFQDAQISLADTFWDEPANHKNISSLMRKCAKARNQTRPWTYEPTNQHVCPACGSNVKTGVAICKDCGAVQPGMEQTARKFFPERFAEDAPAAAAPKSRKNTPRNTTEET